MLLMLLFNFTQRLPWHSSPYFGAHSKVARWLFRPTRKLCGQSEVAMMLFATPRICTSPNAIAPTVYTTDNSTVGTIGVGIPMLSLPASHCPCRAIAQKHVPLHFSQIREILASSSLHTRADTHADLALLMLFKLGPLPRRNWSMMKAGWTILLLLQNVN